MTTTLNNPALDKVWTEVSTIFEELTHDLQLQHLDIVLFRSDCSRSDDTDCAADTTAKWQYRQAKITVYLPHFSHLDRTDIRRVLCHELVHVLVNPMEDKVPERFTDQCELAVENVTVALIALLERG